MVTPVGTPKLEPLILKYGGGINSRASEPDINDIECVDGQNFDLDLLNREFRNRKGIDLVAAAPNAGSIDGYAQLKKVDGTITTLIQAGTNVYSWDGESDFVLEGTVAAGTKLRGPLNANFLLDDIVIIADLARQNAVLEWDGSTLSTMTHNLVGDFKAKYVFVENERAFYSNVESNSVVTPHMVVGSKRGDYDNLSTSTRPASGNAVDDPFFLLTLDLRPINGIVNAYGTIVFSSEEGSIYQLTGVNSKDFAIKGLFPNSFASGDEAIAYVGNDVFFGRPGRIESLISSDRFGDVEADDISRWISDQISDYDDWTVVYNPRTQRAYFFADGETTLWVLHKSLLDSVSRQRTFTIQPDAEGSPWSKWVTLHPIDFSPTTVFTIFDPVDGLQKVFMGDSSGNIFRLEGSGNDDAGFDIKTSRTSKLYTIPIDADITGIDGYFLYRQNEAIDVTLKFIFSGDSSFTETITESLSASTDGFFYGGLYYYGGDIYYGSATRGRFLRKTFAPAGRERGLQIVTETQDQTAISVQQVGLRFQTQQ